MKCTVCIICRGEGGDVRTNAYTYRTVLEEGRQRIFTTIRTTMKMMCQKTLLQPQALVLWGKWGGERRGQ